MGGVTEGADRARPGALLGHPYDATVLVEGVGLPALVERAHITLDLFNAAIFRVWWEQQ